MLGPIIAFLLKGPTEAIACATLCSVVPFAHWLTHVIVALVTLRKGPAEGALVLLWASLPNIVLAATIQPQMGWYSLLSFYLLGYSLAVLLYYTATWSMLFNALFIVSVIVVGSVHWFVPDIHSLWLNQLQAVRALLKQRMHTSFNPTDSLNGLAHIATGMHVAMVCLGNLWHVAIARALQSRAFNVGGFSRELRHIQLHPSISVGMIIILLAAKQGSAVGLDLLPIVGLISGLSGLSIAALIAYNAKLKLIGYVVLYSVLLLSFPYGFGALALLAWVNSVFNITKHYEYKSL